MRRATAVLALAAAALFLVFVSSTPVALAQNRIIVPASSIERAEDRGLRAHTNIILNVHTDSTVPPPNAETPASLACIYRLVTPPVPGCPIATTTAVPTGGVGAIGIVDAFDNPNAVTDINTYAAQFGLPTPKFQVVFADGNRPSNDAGGWSLEEALDIEMAVATAPNAMIFLVEAHDNSFDALYLAEQVASNLVASNGGGTVSNSWSGGEYTGQQTDENSFFNTPGVVYFASSGDAGINNVGVPSTFAKVVAVGGTTIHRNGQGKFTTETWWTGGGGGSSRIEARPGYQTSIKTIVGSKRGVPDISAVGDPNSGPAVYDLDGGFKWFQVGGTSVSAPYIAGVVNSGGKLNPSSIAELSMLYHEYADSTQYAKAFRDITSGGSECTTGWDFCTGGGVPISAKGK